MFSAHLSKFGEVRRAFKLKVGPKICGWRNPRTAYLLVRSSNLFGVRSFESIVLILIGLFIFGFAFYKGYKVWDTYPGYMLKHRALRDAQKHLKDEREQISHGADTKLGPQIREFENIGSVLSAKRAQLDALLQKIDGELSGLYGKFDQIEQAGNVAMKIYP
jgi:hypothetical protein